MAGDFVVSEFSSDHSVTKMRWRILPNNPQVTHLFETRQWASRNFYPYLVSINTMVSTHISILLALALAAQPAISMINGVWPPFKQGLGNSTLQRPQEPKKPYPYLEREVNFENKRAGVRLVGTLTVPASGGPSPAVILIPG